MESRAAGWFNHASYDPKHAFHLLVSASDTVMNSASESDRRPSLANHDSRRRPPHSVSTILEKKQGEESANPRLFLFDHPRFHLMIYHAESWHVSCSFVKLDATEGDRTWQRALEEKNMTKLAISIALFGLAGWITGCHRADPLQNDDETEIPGDSDPFSDSEIDTDSGTEGTHPQSPITFEVYNENDVAMYVDAGSFLSFQRWNGGDWEPTHLEMPLCSVGCEQTSGDELHCCIYCERMLTVLEIPPDDHRDVTVSGQSWIAHYEPCSDECACYSPGDTPTGRYRANVQASRNIDCWIEPCEADENGTIEGAILGEQAKTYTLEFQVPFDKGEIHISIRD